MTDGNLTSTLAGASTIESTITMIFIALVLIGVVLFLASMGSYAMSSTYSEPYEREQTPEEQKQLFKEAEEQAIGTETQPWNCKNCGGPNDHQFCAYCGRAKE